MTPFDPEKITFFAKTDARGQHVPFGIKARDRQRHMYVIGKTGMGKSTMLENMAIQDIQNGEGIAFIDPHGSTADKLLDYVPKERMKDVLYFAPFDMEHPVSFNVMEDVGPDKRHLVVSGLMSTFKKIWVDAWSARMEYILSNTLLALLEYPDSTLLGVNRMLSDKNYREAVVANISDPSVKSFWVDEFAKYNERYMQEAGDSIKNKIGQFTANPLIRNIIGQPKSSFNVRQIMDEQKIFIINLSKGLVGETNANLLGSMLITRIYLSAMSRADLSAVQMEKMPNFYFFVDEFQSFANETFANILSEARKYKLNLTIAHQYIEQMEEEVRNAVFGNVGTTVSFRVGPLDAEFLETVFQPQFMATDLVNLGFAQVYLTLMIDGIGSRPFSAITLPPIEQAEVSYHDQIIAASRKQFAHPRAEVEAEINKWHEPVAPLPKSERPGGNSGGNTGGNNRGGGNNRDGGRKGPGGSGNNHGGRGGGNQQGGGSGGRDGGQKPVQHKDMNELRDVLRGISGTSEKKTEHNSGVVDREQEKIEKIEKTENKDEKKQQGVEQSRSEPKPREQAGREKNSRRRGKGEQRGREQGNQGNVRNDDKTEGTKNTDARNVDDLRAVLANLAKQTEKKTPKPESGTQESMKKGDANSSRTSAQPGNGGEEAGEAPSASPATKLNPADELTRKQLERMLRVNGQERPPLR